MTNPFLDGSSSENGFHLPKINSFNGGARHGAMSRVSSLGDMVDKLDRNHPQEERKKEFQYRLKSRQMDEFGSASASSLSDGNFKAVNAPDINKVSMPIFGKNFQKIKTFWS